jgi:autotransporter-associated beta strand protein
MNNLPPKRAACSALMAIVLLSAPARAAVTHTWTAGVTGTWSTSSFWTNGVPNAQGDVAQQTTGGTAGPVTTVDINAVIGQIANRAGSGTLWTIESDSSHKLILDNAGGSTNDFGTTNGFIGYTSSGTLVVRPDIVLRNTHLDVGTSNTGVVNVQPGLVIGQLGASTITAATPQLLNIRMNSTTVSGGAANAVINSDIGGSGTSMAIWNEGTGTGTVAIAGRVLNQVVELRQDSATSPLTLLGNNTYSGPTLITAGTLIAAADGALGESDVTVSPGAQLTLTGGTAQDYLDDDASLTLAAASLINLNYTGADTIGSLILNGVGLPAGTYGSPTSNAAMPLPIFTGAGTLRVAGGVAAVPEPSAAAFAALAMLRRRRRRA